MNYKKRVVDDLLARKLRGMGAVLVQGAKWCGKTTTCEEFAKSALYMADPDTKEANVKMADIDIKSLLKGTTPRLIDAEMFVNKVAFYLWNDVFKDCELDGEAFKITREGGEVDVLAFQDFFKEDGAIDEEVLKTFLTTLVSPSEPENGAAPQASTGA